LKATKLILQYIWGTVQFEIHYSSGRTPLLSSFIDSNWVGVFYDQNYIAGYVFILGSGPATWDCKKQQDISLSSTKSKYQAVVNAS
jgi:hypothetical protein